MNKLNFSGFFRWWVSIGGRDLTVEEIKSIQLKYRNHDILDKRTRD